MTRECVALCVCVCERLWVCVSGVCVSRVNYKTTDYAVWRSLHPCSLCECPSQLGPSAQSQTGDQYPPHLLRRGINKGPAGLGRLGPALILWGVFSLQRDLERQVKTGRLLAHSVPRRCHSQTRSRVEQREQRVSHTHTHTVTYLNTHSQAEHTDTLSSCPHLQSLSSCRFLVLIHSVWG